LQTTQIAVRGQHLRIPTLAETLRVKGWLAVSRNATRDYLDLAALSDHAGLHAAARALADLDDCYQDVYRSDVTRDVSVALQLARQLADPIPYDLEQTDLPTYKRLDARWQDWGAVCMQLRALAVALTESLTQSNE
jgi:hypothetical protein